VTFLPFSPLPTHYGATERHCICIITIFGDPPFRIQKLSPLWHVSFFTPTFTLGGDAATICFDGLSGSIYSIARPVDVFFSRREPPYLWREHQIHETTSLPSTGAAVAAKPTLRGRSWCACIPSRDRSVGSHCDRRYGSIWTRGGCFCCIGVDGKGGSTWEGQRDHQHSVSRAAPRGAGSFALLPSIAPLGERVRRKKVAKTRNNLDSPRPVFRPVGVFFRPLAPALLTCKTDASFTPRVRTMCGQSGW